MANSNYNGIYYVDTAGIISKTALSIKGILWVPAAITNAFDLNFWDEGSPSYTGSFNASSATGVVTETDTDTHTLSAAQFPATSVVKILAQSSCVAANKTYHLIGTVGDNHAYTVDPVGTMTDESAKEYAVSVFPARAFFNCSASSVTNAFESKYHYLGGVWIPNLVAETVTSGSYAIIYT